MKGIDVFMIVVLVVVAVVVLAMKLMREKEKPARPSAQDEAEPESDAEGEGLNESESIYADEPASENMAEEQARSFGKGVTELPFGDENQIVAIGSDLVLMKPERRMGLPLPRINGRIIDHMQVVCSRRLRRAYSLFVHELKPHNYLLSCFEIAASDTGRTEMKHLFVHRTDKAKLAHVFLTPSEEISQVALIDRDGLQMDFYNPKADSVDIVDFDRQLIADHGSSIDRTFFTFDGRLLTRWEVDDNHELSSTSDIDAPFGLERAFFRQGRHSTYRQFPPVLCTSQCAIFTDTKETVSLVGMESALANRFFAAGDALWQFAFSKLSKIADEPQEPMLYTDDSDEGELEGFAVFKGKLDSSVFVYWIYQEQLEMKRVSGIKGRVLDCSFDWNEMALYIFSTEQTLKILIDDGEFEPVLTVEGS